VTAIRPEELPDDPSSFATVIEVDEHRGEAETVQGLLDESVGVQVRSFGGPGQASEVTIRGSTGQQVVILLDGVRLNTAQSGTVDLSTLPLEIVDRIEISRGGGSTQAGSGAIGGVINIVTKRGTGKPRSSASVSGGSFGTWRGTLSHSDRAGPVDWGASYAGFTTDGDWKFQSVELRADGVESVASKKLKRVNNDSESHSMLVQAAGDLAPGLHLRGWDNFFYVSRGQPGPDTDPEAPNGGQSDSAHERRSRNVASLKLEGDGWEVLPDSVRFESTLSYLYEQSRFREPEPKVGDQPIETRQKNRSAAWQTAGSWEGDFGGAEHVARLALALRYDSLSSNEEGFHRRYSEGVTISNELGFWKSRLQLIPTLRYDHTDDFGSEWIPQLGLIVTPVPWLRIKANAERSYRVPDFDELFFPDKGFIRGNPNLDAEKAWNYDAGFELGVAELGFLDRVRLQWAYFYQDIDNSIVFQRISSSTVAPTNTNDASVEGFELSGSFEMFDWVRFSANWTHQDGELDRPQLPSDPGLFPPIQQFPGTAIPGQADDEYQLRLRVGPKSQLFKIVAERRHTSKIHLNFSNSSTLSGRTVYDLSSSLDLAQLWRLDSRWFPGQLIASVSVNNLTDESVRDSVGFPQPGRTLYFGLEAQW
jgi:outer membrane cobalamin receptor